MKNQIDFLQEFKKKESAAQKITPFFHKGIIFLAVFYLLVASGILFSVFYYRNENNQILVKIDQKKKKIDQLQKIESLQVLVKERLSALTKILNEKRINFSETVSYFEDLGREKNLVFNKIEIEEGGLVRVSGRTTDRLTIMNFLEELERQETPFLEINLNSLLRNKDGGYDFSLTFKKSL